MRILVSLLGVAAVAGLTNAQMPPTNPLPSPLVVPNVTQPLPSPSVIGQPFVVGQPYTLPGQPPPGGQPSPPPGPSMTIGKPMVTIQSPNSIRSPGALPTSPFSSAPNQPLISTPMTQPPSSSGSPPSSSSTQPSAPSTTTPTAPSSSTTPTPPTNKPITVPDPAAPAPATVGRSQTALKIVELKNGPASDAGFKTGDIILRIDDLRTKSFDDIRTALTASTGKSTIEYYRPSTGVRGVKEVTVKDTKIGIVVELAPILLNDPDTSP